MEQEQLYYQATETNTRFHAAPADPEETGIDGYRAAERQEILEFLDGSDQVLVIGGMRGTGKTYTLENMAIEHSLHYLDMMRLITSRHVTLDDYSSMKDANGVLYGRYREYSCPRPRALIIDEGMTFVLYDELKKNDKLIIEGFLTDYEKIIILGGGDQFTSEEQTDAISSSVPSQLSTQKLPFPFKLPNLKQVADIVRLQNPGVAEEIIAIIAATYIDYFRTLHIIRLISRHRTFFPDLCDDHFKMPFMPQNCVDIAWEEQRERYLEAKDRVRELLKG